MSAITATPARPRAKAIDGWKILETVGAWLCAILWLAPLVYALWASLHSAADETSYSLTTPLTLQNYIDAWNAAPFAQYYLNTVLLVLGILAAQLVLSTLAAYAFAKVPFRGSGIAFWLILVQLMIAPDVLISENYTTMAKLGMVDTLTAIGLPFIASAFAIFLLRQTFKSIPKELHEAAEIEGCSRLQLLWKVYVPLARPTYVAFGLVSISAHWNTFLWPIVVTNSVASRPLTVGLAIFSGQESGVSWALLSAATIIIIAPLLIAFLIFQRQFVQSFMRAGIR
jgi:sn-glycerol 3-phosphate transport system permease protein